MLKSLTSAPTTDSNLPVACLDAPELCRRLCLSRTTLWRLQRRRRKPIPHVKVGSRVLFPIDAVQRWLSAEANRTAALQ
jgi:excisionase family DNA binding protein